MQCCWSGWQHAFDPTIHATGDRTGTPESASGLNYTLFMSSSDHEASSVREDKTVLFLYGHLPVRPRHCTDVEWLNGIMPLLTSGGLGTRASLTSVYKHASENHAPRQPMIYHLYVIELLVSEGVWKVVYAGATRRGGVRFLEHVNLVGGASRVAASVAVYGALNHRVRVVHMISISDAVEAEEGAAGLPLEVRCLETYLMNKHDTVHPNLNKMRDLLAYENRDAGHKHPDILLPGQPMNFQLNCTRSAGKQHSQSISESGKLFENQTTTLSIYSEEEQREVFAQIFTDLGVEPLQTVLVCCAKKDEGTKRVVFDVDSPFMKARELRVKYEEKNGWEVISADVVSAEVNAIKAMDIKNAPLNSYLRGLMTVCHPDRHVDLTAGEAFHLFGMVEEWTGRREEAALLSTQETNSHAKRAIKWRVWMRENEGATPSATPTAGSLKTLEEKREERCLGQQMTTWRCGDGGKYPLQEERNVYLVLLRTFPIFAQYCYGNAEKSHINATKVNALLRTGHGNEAARKKFPHLVNFPSVCPTCRSHRPEYVMMKGYLSGKNSLTEEALLEGVEAKYATWLRNQHACKVDDMKAKGVESNKKLKEAMYASGVVKKRVKREES